jgi:ELWxxDGT repeat protein
MLYPARLYLNGRDARRRREVWVSDGSCAGTRRLQDLCPGACDGGPVRFREVLGRLLFADSRGNLWVTDGTPAGTARLAGLPPTPNPGYLMDAAPLDGGIVFTGFDPVNGPQPWRSDLTPAGTELVATIGTPPPASGWPIALTALGGKVLFQACAGAEDWIWASDGTAAGTVRLPATSVPCTPTRVFSRFQRAGALAYFPWNGRLWRTDGTPSGTISLLDLPPDTFPRMGAIGGKLVFSLPPPSFPPSSNGWIFTFWTSDGTPAGTRQVFEFRSSSGPVLFAPGDGILLFQAQSYISPFFAEMWRTDGTPAGTFPLLRLRGQVDGRVPQTAVLDGKTYFLAKARSAGPELWMTDGTAAGTAPVLPDLDAPGPRNLIDLVAFRGDLYFAADMIQVSGGPAHPRGLWRSDGTAAGTVLLAELDLPGGLDDPMAPQLTPAGDQLFFLVNAGPGRVELWRTDGTPGGTARVREIQPTPAFAGIIALTAAGGELYFTAGDGVHGNELWRSDGTPAGTLLVRDILPGPGGSNPQELTAADGNLFFNANDGEHGRELWAAPLPR